MRLILGWFLAFLRLFPISTMWIGVQTVSGSVWMMRLLDVLGRWFGLAPAPRGDSPKVETGQ